jgi:hypothetical protein
MPSLRIPFPEKESSSVVVLRGKRITVGRLPQNTIQIRDRTISAYHAELIEEDGHYRLHDVGATNGILVNGEPVTDFHLEAACKVSFGGVECEFSPETTAETEDDPALAILTHGQSQAILTRNVELEKTVASLREKIAELEKPVGDAQGTGDLQRLTEEANKLRESLAARDQELKQLKTDLAVMQRDRTNLQRALNEAKAKPEPAPAPTPVAAAPVPASAPEPAAEAEKQPELELAPQGLTETPKTAAPAPAAPAPAPVPAPAPAAGSAPKQPIPTARPAAVPVPAPKPAAGFPAVRTMAPPSKPGLPKPKAPLPHAAPGAPSTPSTPSNPGAGTASARPIARPQPAVASNGNGTPVAPRAAAPIAKSPGGTNPQATPKPSLATRPPTAVSGPKGTQKIETEG